MSARGDTWSRSNDRLRASTSNRSRPSASATRGRYPSQTVHPGQPRWQRINETWLRPPSPPLGLVLATLSEKDLTVAPELEGYSAKITDCECVASYNWLNRKEPIILVPGKPAVWTPPETPVKLREDSGSYFRDQNAARYPEHPTEPAIQALFTEHAGFSSTSIDVFACGSTMGNLLRFVRKIDKPFRFHVEVVGNTVFFIRRENSPTELIPDVRGYGHTFPEAYTTWDTDTRGSESHQRIVMYTFGGLKCLVRFESDGYLRDLVPSNGPQKSHTSRKSAESCEDTDPTSLFEAFSLTSLDQNPPASNKTLIIKRGGQKVPQDAVFDLKTRSGWKKDRDILAEEIARLWIAQIPNFVVAFHTSGVFKDIRTQNVRTEIDAWETENEHVLCQLAVLIRKIIGFAKDRSDGKLEIRRAGVDVLELRKQAGDDCAVLPPHVKARWAGELGSEGAEAAGLEEEVATLNVPFQKEEPRELESGRVVPVHQNDELYHDPDRGFDSDEEFIKDFTACSAESCGYCGHCTY